MYSPDNHKAFKVSKKLWAKWEDMTDRNDHAGRHLEEIMFIKKGLEKIGSPLAEFVYDLECESSWIVGERERNGGLTAEQVTKSLANYKMALACLEIETGSDGIIHVTMGK